MCGTPRVHIMCMCAACLIYFVVVCVCVCVNMQLWDIGGQPRFRTMWERYCRGVTAIVYMVDAADHEKLETAKTELLSLLEKPQLAGIPVSVVCVCVCVHNVWCICVWCVYVQLVHVCVHNVYFVCGVYVWYVYMCSV